MEKGIEVSDLCRVEPWDGGHGQENENENSGVVHRADAYFYPRLRVECGSGSGSRGAIENVCVAFPHCKTGYLEGAVHLGLFFNSLWILTRNLTT